METINQGVIYGKQNYSTEYRINFPKGPGKIYFYRYQVDGHRKTVSLQTANRAEALRKAEEFIPIIKATSAEVAAAHVQQAKGFATAKRDLPLSGVWDYYSMHPDRANPATIHEQLQYKTSLMEQFLSSFCI